MDAIWVWDADTASWLVAGRDVPESLWTLTEVQSGADATLVISEGEPVTLPAPAPGIQGRAADDEGAPLAGRRVLLHRIAGGEVTGESLEVATDEQGRFRFDTPATGRHRVELFPRAGRECSIFYVGGEQQWTAYSHGASVVQFDGEDISGIDFKIDASVCDRAISGSIMRADGARLMEMKLAVFSGDPPELLRTHSIEPTDGSFRAYVPEPGAYRLRLEIGQGCFLLADDTGLTDQTHSWRVDQARVFPISDEDVNLRFSVDAGICAGTLSARILDAEGVPLSGALVDASTRDGSYHTSHETDSDGLWAATLSLGEYLLQFRTPDECTYYVSGDVATINYNESVLIRVEANDVHRDIRILDGYCKYAISGTIRYASGEPAQNFTVGASGASSLWQTTTGEDGSYAVVVPKAVAYEIRLEWPDVSCSGSVRSDGIVARSTIEPDLFHVVVADIQRDVVIPAGTCEYSFSGTITGIDDKKDIGLSLVALAGSSGISGGSINEDGSFTVYGSQQGPHLLSMQIGLNRFLTGGQLCSRYAADGGVTADYGQAQVFDVNAEGTPRDIRIHIPSDVCER